MRENWETCSELLRHDVAFVFRHMDKSCRVAVSQLIECFENLQEHPIVRHEAIMSLGYIIEDCSVIEPFVNDPELIVSESCLIAINMIKVRAKQKQLKAEKERQAAARAETADDSEGAGKDGDLDHDGVYQDYDDELDMDKYYNEVDEDEEGAGSSSAASRSKKSESTK